MKNIPTTFILILAMGMVSWGAAPWQGQGRIAISSDGNEHDHDDWAATPFSLAMLAAAGLQDQMVLYTYSDHIWGSNHDHSDARQQMRISALDGADWFGFDRSRFIEAVSAPNTAYNALAEEINQSSAQDPLFIIAAGPMHVVGTALSRSQMSQRQFVTVISHSRWNDRHSDNPGDWENHNGWTWDEMENTFSRDGVQFLHIVDQNGGTGYDGMRADQSKFDWLLTSSAKNHPAYKPGAWDWLYSRQEEVIKQGDFDPSDAGMVIYLLTGIEMTNPADAKDIMENPVTASSSSSVSSSSVSSSSVSSSGTLPGDITDLSLSLVSGAVKLTWSDTQGEDEYRIRRKQPGDSRYTNLTDVNAGVTTWTDEAVSQGQTYIYMVRPLVDNQAVAISNTPEITVTISSSSSISSSSASSSSVSSSSVYSSSSTSGLFFIQNRATGNRLRPMDDLDGAPMVMAPGDWNGLWVQWEKVETENGYFYLKNKKTGKFFRPSSGDEDSQLDQRPTDWGGFWTQWKTEPTQNEWFYLQNRSTGMFFRPQTADDISSATGDAYLAVQKPTSYGGYWTQWTFVPVDGALARQQQVHSELKNTQQVQVFSNSLGIELNWANSREFQQADIFSVRGKHLRSYQLYGEFGDVLQWEPSWENGLFVIRLTGPKASWQSGVLQPGK